MCCICSSTKGRISYTFSSTITTKFSTSTSIYNIYENVVVFDSTLATTISCTIVASTLVH
jgi:hypothetical protein